MGGGVALTSKLFDKIFAEKCMKMKEIGSEEGRPYRPPKGP